jgi:hypothetical protein
VNNHTLTISSQGELKKAGFSLDYDLTGNNEKITGEIDYLSNKEELAVRAEVKKAESKEAKILPDGYRFEIENGEVSLYQSDKNEPRSYFTIARSENADYLNPEKSDDAFRKWVSDKATDWGDAEKIPVDTSDRFAQVQEAFKNEEGINFSIDNE